MCFDKTQKVQFGDKLSNEEMSDLALRNSNDKRQRSKPRIDEDK